MNIAAQPSTTSPAKGLSAVYQLRLPPRFTVWEAAIASIKDSKLRVSALVEVAYKDPVLVIELLKAAGSVLYSGDKSSVVTVKGAIERLGAEGAAKSCELTLSTASPILDNQVSEWFEVFRKKSVKVGTVARMLAEVLAPTLVEDCQLAGELVHVGNMLAVLHFGEAYVKMAADANYTKVLYRLEKDHQFNVETVGVNYLRKNGIPELVLFAIDEKATVKAPARTIMKPLIAAATELVQAFDDEKLDKLAPGATIPVKSAIRILKISDAQYATVYERVSNYLKATVPTPV